MSSDRLLILALVVTAASADGLRRAWRQRQEALISQRLFVTFCVALGVGVGLAWIGFLVEWLG